MRRADVLQASPDAQPPRMPVGQCKPGADCGRCQPEASRQLALRGYRGNEDEDRYQDGGRVDDCEQRIRSQQQDQWRSKAWAVTSTAAVRRRHDRAWIPVPAGGHSFVGAKPVRTPGCRRSHAVSAMSGTLSNSQPNPATPAPTVSPAATSHG